MVSDFWLLVSPNGTNSQQASQWAVRLQAFAVVRKSNNFSHLMGKPKEKKKQVLRIFSIFFKKRFPAMMGELSICPTKRRRRNHEREATSIKTCVCERHSISSGAHALLTSEWDVTESWLTTGQKVSGDGWERREKVPFQSLHWEEEEAFVPWRIVWSEKKITSSLQLTVDTLKIPKWNF